MDTVCIIGLGLMGRPMARTLLKAGWTVRGWNRSPLAEELVRDIPQVHTLAEAAQADICLLMLTDSKAVEAVLAQLEPHLNAGQVVLDMGASDPAHSKTHAERLAARGVGWVDAPVSGGPGSFSSICARTAFISWFSRLFPWRRIVHNFVYSPVIPLEVK